MAQFTVDITAVVRNGQLAIRVQRGDQFVESVLPLGEVVDPLSAVEWAVNRTMDDEAVATAVQKRVTFSATQQPDGTWAVDSVDSVETLPADVGRNGLATLPGWASWSAQEAANWIDGSVTDLTSAKAALQAMAKAIVYLRKAVVGR